MKGAFKQSSKIDELDNAPPLLMPRPDLRPAPVKYKIPAKPDYRADPVKYKKPVRDNTQPQIRYQSGLSAPNGPLPIGNISGPAALSRSNSLQAGFGRSLSTGSLASKATAKSVVNEGWRRNLQKGYKYTVGTAIAGSEIADAVTTFVPGRDDPPDNIIVNVDPDDSDPDSDPEKDPTYNTKDHIKYASFPK